MGSVEYQNHHLDAKAIAGALQKSRRTGPGKYVACCPAHDDKNPSLSIQDAPSGKVLVHCHAGCSQDDVIGVLRARGLWNKQSCERVAYLKQQSLNDQIRFNQIILATETQRAREGYVHSEFERAQIKRAIKFLEEHS